MTNQDKTIASQKLMQRLEHDFSASNLSLKQAKNVKILFQNLIK